MTFSSSQSRGVLRRLPCCGLVLASFIAVVLTIENFANGASVSSATNQLPTDIEQSVCQSDYFRARCSGADEVLIVTRALYGRMRMSKCVKENFGYVGCSNDVIEIVDGQCSGRRECSIRILDENFMNAKPCHDDLKSYLQVNYHCVKVISADRQDCQAHRPLVVTNRTGYLASLTSAETGCGTSESPWYIEALPGQRINITLFDFTPPDTAIQSASGRVHTGVGIAKGLVSTPEMLGGVSGVARMCRVYATIREMTSKRSTTVCGAGTSRQKTVHISVDHQVEIRIINSHSSPKSLIFVLKYEAVGCPKLREPVGGWAKHESDDEAIFGCFGDAGDTWRLVCHGSTWIGDYRNCSPGLSIAIIVTLAVAIWLAILAVGIVCLKSLRAAGNRRQRRLAAAHSGNAAITDETYYGGSSDCRSVLNLSEFHRLEQQPFSSCVTCSTSGSCDQGKQQTVVCTLRNARTATVLHRIQQQNDVRPTTHLHGNGRRGNDVGDLFQLAGDVDVGDVMQEKNTGAKAETFCHSPYCIYAKTLPHASVGIGSIAATATDSASDDKNIVSLESNTYPGDGDHDGGHWPLMSNQLNLSRCLNSPKNNFVNLSPVGKTSFQTQIRPMTLMDNDLTRYCLATVLSGECSPRAQLDLVGSHVGDPLQV